MSLSSFLQLLLTPKYRESLPVVLMILMTRGIHHDVIFQLIFNVELITRKFQSLILISCQLRVFLKLTGLFKSHQVLLNRTRKSTYTRQTSFVRFFDYFSQKVMMKMLKRIHFNGVLPLIFESYDNCDDQEFPSLKILLGHCNSLPPKYGQLMSLSFSENRLHLLKTATELQEMVVSMRERYPELVLFLRGNPNAVLNAVLCWTKQVSLYEITPQNPFVCSINSQRTSMDFFLIVILVAVIDPTFLDDVLSKYVSLEIIDQDLSSADHVKLISMLQSSTRTVLGDYARWFRSGNFLELIQMISSIMLPDSDCLQFMGMRYWSFIFGYINPHCDGAFHTESIGPFTEGLLIFDVFGSFCKAFFANLNNSLPVLDVIGNTFWEIHATEFLERKLVEMIRTAVSQFAYNMGEKDKHAWLSREIKLRNPFPRYQFDVTPQNYKKILFPDIHPEHETMMSVMVYQFWQTHPRPAQNMPDIEYLHWLLSMYATEIPNLSIDRNILTPTRFLLILSEDRRILPVPRTTPCPCDTTDLSNIETQNKDLECDFRRYFAGAEDVFTPNNFTRLKK
jgi:hypothetical protein